MSTPTINELQNQVTALQGKLALQKQERITSALNDLVAECRLTILEAPKAIARAMADESYLDELRLRPQNLPGAAPLDIGLQVINADMRDVMKGMRQHVVNGPEAIVNAAQRGREISRIYSRERDRILPVLNAAAVNTIDVSLKRVSILQETVRDFATRVLPLRLFSTVFNDVPLQGTDEVVVPYFPLQAAASKDFTDGDGSGGTGYQFGQATNTSSKKITVNKRKYQPLDYSSNEFRRQPWFDAVRLGRMNAEKLAVDVLTDVLSVITAAKFGVASKNIAAAAYTSDDVIDLCGVANALNWPDIGRALIVDSTVDTALQKDDAYKLALNIGTSSVIQQGRFPKLSGFDYAWMPNFPANAENLIGIIAFASAILAAFSPVAPAAGVRAQLVAYEIATDPTTGISLNYRHWGDPQADRDFEVMETAYGYEAGIDEALRRLTTP